MKLGPPELEDFTDREVEAWLHPAPTKEDRYKELVKEWTLNAQSCCFTDDEKHLYYKCAEQLHRINQIGQIGMLG